MAKVRINRTLNNPTPPSADLSFQEGDQALIWRDKIFYNHIREWMAPFMLVGIEPKKILT